MQWLHGAALAAVLLAAAVSDLRTRRIPNALVLGGTAAGLALRGFGGLDPLLAGAAGAAAGLLVGLALFSIGALGGGDGKLLMVVGAFFGPRDLVGAILAIAIAGALFALVWAVRSGTILPALGSTGRTLKYLATFGRAGELAQPAPVGDVRGVPYAVAIAAGAVTWWFWRVPLL